MVLHYSQLEDLLPGRCEGLVLRVGLHAVVAELDDGEGVRLAADVGRVEALRLQHLHHQVTHVLHLGERVPRFLQQGGEFGLSTGSRSSRSKRVKNRFLSGNIFGC